MAGSVCVFAVIIFAWRFDTGDIMPEAERKNITRIGLAMFVMLAVDIALQYAAVFLLSDFLTAENRYWLRYAVSVVPQYLFAMPLAYLVMKTVPAASPAKKSLSPGRLLMAVVISYAILYAGSLISTLISEIISSFVNYKMSNVIEEMVRGSGILPNFVFVGLLAPAAEELFFRRTLINRLIRYGDKPAIVVSGLIFGLAHGNFSQFFYAFGLGAALGYVYIRTGKIGYTIALHMFINLIGGVLGPYILEHAKSFVIVYGAAVIISAIIGGILFIKNIMRLRFEKGIYEPDNWKRAFFLNAGMALFIAACAAVFVMNTIYAL